MSYQTPKVAQDIRRLRVDVEFVVRNMHRSHRYASGDELRAGFYQRYPWLHAATVKRQFDPTAEHRVFRIPHGDVHA